MKQTLEHWVKSILSNDETMSNEDMVEYFIEEGPMSREEAEAWVGQRSFYLTNIVMDDGRVYDPKQRKIVLPSNSRME